MVITFYAFFIKVILIFVTLPIHINCLDPNTLDMMILCLDYSLSYICYLLLHIDVLRDIVHLVLLFLPSVAYLYLSAVPILSQSFLGILAITIIPVSSKVSWIKLKYLKTLVLKVLKHIMLASNNVLPCTKRS